MSGSTETSTTGHDTHLYDPDRHDNQIVAVFHDRAAAERARDALIQAGTPASAIEIIDQPPGSTAGLTGTAEDSGSVGSQIMNAFTSLFSSDHDQHYAQAVERGHAMLVLSPQPGTDRHAMVAALEQSGPIDFDAKLEEWRQAGYDQDGTPATTPATGERRQGVHDQRASSTRVRSYIADRR